MFKVSSFGKILIALFLAIVAGFLTKDLSVFGVSFISLYEWIKELFLNSLKAVIVPLVASSIIVSLSGAGEEKSIGKLGLKLFSLFFFTTTCAVLIGWLFAYVLSMQVDIPLETVSFSYPNSIDTSIFSKIKSLSFRFFPENIIDACAKGQMLSVILFSLLFGYFMSKLEKETGRILSTFWKGVFQIMMSITKVIMKALPLGVFAMVAHVVATSGSSSLKGTGFFFLSVIEALFFFALLLFALLYFLGKINPFRFVQALMPALLTAFSTSSSSLSLPVTLNCMEKRIGVSNRIASFALPIGTTMNMAGSALFMVMATLFIAKMQHVPLTVVDHLIVICMTILLSFGMAGIPSAALISVILLLETIGISAQGIGLIVAVERLMDMFRSPVNVLTCSCSTYLLAVSEKETPVFSFQAIQQE